MAQCNSAPSPRRFNADYVSSTAAGVTTPALCKALLRGIRVQLIMTGEMGLNTVGIGVPEEETKCQEMLEEEWEKFYDSVSGTELNTKMVKAARLEELTEIRKRKIYDKVPLSECWSKTGKKPIKCRFVDVNKGDNETPNYRSRLVAQEFNDGSPAHFAATPPLEAVKTLFSLGASQQDG